MVVMIALGTSGALRFMCVCICVYVMNIDSPGITDMYSISLIVIKGQEIGYIYTQTLPVGCKDTVEANYI